MKSARLIAVGLLGLACSLVEPITAAAGEIGALAYSRRTGALGYSYNYDDEDDARQRAMSECRKYSNDCKIARTFTNVCVMVARDGTKLGWAWGYETDERQRRAINQCRGDGGRNCKVVTKFCTGDAED
jgi:hypothetical protein